MSTGISLKDNAQFISESEVNGLDTMLSDYIVKKAVVDDYEITLKKVSNLLKQLAKDGIVSVGTNQTTHNEFKINIRRGTKSLNKTAILEKYPEILNDESMWTTSADTYVLEKVYSREVKGI